jgi:ribosome recycling factor
MLTVQVWDRGLVIAVDKAIRSAGLGLNPQVDGQLLRIPIPPLTEDRRKELSKIAAKYAEAARVAIRNIRRDGMEHLKKLEKEHQISEDEHKKQSESVQKATDGHIKEVDEALGAKEKEIMQV